MSARLTLTCTAHDKVKSLMHLPVKLGAKHLLSW